MLETSVVTSAIPEVVGYPEVVIQRWLSRGGYPEVVIQRWLSRGGYPEVVIQKWLSRGGYHTSGCKLCGCRVYSEEFINYILLDNSDSGL